MAFPTPVFRGRAQIEGTNNTMNVILHKTVRTMTVSREFDEAINQDEHGNDVAWKAQNEKKMLDVDMYLMANSNATLANVKLNAVFLNIYTQVNITNSDVTEVNGVYTVVSGDSISLEQAATGKMAVKLRRYADSDQNNIAVTTPS
jgi:hypothetical protein